jgi:hypothetical protein
VGPAAGDLRLGPPVRRSGTVGADAETGRYRQLAGADPKGPIFDEPLDDRTVDTSAVTGLS